MYTPLKDYLLIGNSRSAALISNKGSIDWCCLPIFDSPGIFAAILDSDKGGHFAINPDKPFKSSHSYISDTNVAETIFKTDEGEARLLDAFTVLDEDEKLHSLIPDHEILRIVEGTSGNINFELHLVPRFYYGKHLPKFRDKGKMGISWSHREHIFSFLTTLEPEQCQIDPERAVISVKFNIKEGQRIFFSLTYSGQSPSVIPELSSTGWDRMGKTIKYWKKFANHCTYTGIYQKEVRRSALVLKLLTFAPSGAIIAAPTSSLPEEVGGGRNWDYRYCWLRDASFTIRALLNLGYDQEARAYMSWILHATRLTRPKLKVVYTVFGKTLRKEKKLEWLNGYKNSKPVHIGNKADSQFQLDVYGEVLDAFYAYTPLLKSIDRSTRKFLLGLGKVICDSFNEPDNGIWEIRSSSLHHTHSKVMAWVGLDRLIKLAKQYKWKDAPVDKFSNTADIIKKKIERCGYNHQVNAYTRELSGTELDGSLLTLPLLDYCSASSPQMLSTRKEICQKLSYNHLIYRYKNVNDGLEGEEGAFNICNFWLSENLAKTGDVEEAMKYFEAVVQKAGPGGLLSEEIDPVKNELVGNYPQGFTHIGLINAALSINDAIQKRNQNTNERQ